MSANDIYPEVEAIPPGDLDRLSAVLKDLLTQISARIHYADARRTAVVTFGGALLAASIAMFAATQNSMDFWPLKLAMAAFLTANALLVGYLWVIYSRQTNFKYPFRGRISTWKWFYASALENERAFVVKWHAKISDKEIQESQQEVDKQWLAFREKQIPGLANVKASISQDIAQLYTLHLNEKYKNLFLSHLRTVFAKGLGISAIVFFSVLAVGSVKYFIFENRFVTSNGMYSSNNVSVKSSWRDTGKNRAAGYGREEVEVLINFSIDNQNSAEVTFDKVLVKDSTGLTLPITVDLLQPRPIVIPAKSQGEAIALIWVTSSLRSSINRFEVLK